MGSIHSIINVTTESGEKINEPAPLSDGAKKALKDMFRQGVPDPYYDNSPNDNPAAKELLDYYKLEASAFLGLPLGTQDHTPGGVLVLAERGEYDDSQLRLMSLLRAPFQVAMANALQHAEIVELKDRLADDNKLLLKQHTHMYLSLRMAVGMIGILLPFVLMFGNIFFFQGEIFMRSISRFYHSDMGNIFAGALCAIAIFMFFYSGYGRRERWAGILAGVLTLGTAFFPTTLAGPLDWVGKLHYFCAISLFLLLAWISIFHFPRKRSGEPTQATDRIQVICGVLMMASTVASVVYYYAYFLPRGEETCFVFVAETVALVAFGVSWLTEGLDLKKEILRAERHPLGKQRS